MAGDADEVINASFSTTVDFTDVEALLVETLTDVVELSGRDATDTGPVCVVAGSVLVAAAPDILTAEVGITVADVLLVLALVVETPVLVPLIGLDAVDVVIRTPNGPSVDVVTVSKKGHAKEIVVKGKDDVVLVVESAGKVFVAVVLLVAR